MTNASRRLAGLLAVAAIVVSAVAAGPALATPAKWDPQASNVPYLAWRGEQVRLVKCNPVLAQEGVSVEFFVEEWSGPGLVPRVEDVTVNHSDGCARADVVSLDPGLARVKLVATNSLGDPILKHQFLVIWMSLVDPSIDEVGAADPTGDRSLGDPAGDGSFDAGANNGRIQVNVTGTFPYGGTTYTLPSAWPTLAGLLAQDSDSNPFNNAAKWVDPACVALWARLLDAVPGARLLLKAHQLAHPTARARVKSGAIAVSAPPKIAPWLPPS